MVQRGWTRRAALGFLLTALVTATAGAQPQPPTHVACVGDSLTVGVGASTSSSTYPAQLQTLLGSAVTVRSFGHSGATMLGTGDTPYRLEREYVDATAFASEAGDGARVAVIVLLGTNDSKTRNWRSGAATMAARFELDYGAMIDHFAGLPTHPTVYAALPPAALISGDNISGSVIRDEIAPVIRRVARGRGVPVIDLQTPTDGHAEYFVDGVHPNDDGYAVVAEQVRDGLARDTATTVDAPMGTGCQVGSGDRGANGVLGMVAVAAMVIATRRRGGAARAGASVTFDASRTSSPLPSPLLGVYDPALEPFVPPSVIATEDGHHAHRNLR